MKNLIKIMSRKKSLPPLPGPVLHIIFQQLSPIDVRNCRLVCRLWKQVITFYDLIPEVADYFVDCRVLVKTSSWSIKRSLLKLLPQTSATTTLQSLTENYLQNSAHYFLRHQGQLRIRAFEELTSFSPFISPPILPALSHISALDLESFDDTKCSTMNLQHFEEFLSHFPSLQRLSLPLLLISVIGPDKNLAKPINSIPEGKMCSLLPCLESLAIRIPTLSLLMDKGAETILRVQLVAILLASKSFPALENLTLKTDPFSGRDTKKSLRSPEMDAFFRDLTQVGDILGNCLNKNLTAMVMSSFSLNTFSLSIIPVRAFENPGFLGLFAYLAMRGLRHLHLSVTASALETSLPTILSMILNYGCGVDLDLEFFLHGTESQLTTQYLLSLPEMCENLCSLTLRFLADYDDSGHMFFLEDFVPFHTRLNPGEGAVNFKKLTTFRIRFERPTHKAFLTFGWLRVVWPHLRHISIIVGRPEGYQSERRITWGLLKDKWKGRRSTAVTNVFYLRGILKFFPQLATLLFWGDLGKVGDGLLAPVISIIGRPGERLTVAQCVPELQEMSLRGLGSGVSSNCIRGFYGMKELTKLELIGNHGIKNSTKSKLLLETPSLKRIKFKL